MQMTQILMVAAALFATISSVHFFSHRNGSSVLSAQPFTFYTLVLQWPPSVFISLPAGKTCIDDIPVRFTIHGLWPQRKDGSPVHPVDPECNDNYFKPKKLDNILKKKSFYADLKLYWPNLYVEADGVSNFWSIEWNEHGVCSDLQGSPLAYFKCVVDLFNDRQFRNLRQDVGIEVGQSYTLAEIQQKLNDKYKANPQIVCNNKTELWEIRFCYTRVQGREPVDLQDCPKLSDTKYPCDQNGIHLPHAPAPPPASTLRMVSDEAHSEL